MVRVERAGRLRAGGALEDEAAAVVAGAGAEVSMIQSACAMTAWWCSTRR